MQFCCIQQRCCRDDGRSVLVVVHDGNIGGFCDTSFYLKALWGLDVLKVDAPEGFGDVDNCTDEFFRIFGIHFNVKYVNSGKRLQKQAFPLHDRFTG